MYEIRVWMMDTDDVEAYEIDEGKTFTEQDDGYFLYSTDSLEDAEETFDSLLMRARLDDSGYKHYKYRLEDLDRNWE